MIMFVVKLTNLDIFVYFEFDSILARLYGHRIRKISHFSFSWRYTFSLYLNHIICNLNESAASAYYIDDISRVDIS